MSSESYPMEAPFPSKPERWGRLGPTLAAHLARKPDMDTDKGPRRWAQLLLQWACEAMYLAYPKDRWRAAIQETLDDFSCGKAGR